MILRKYIANRPKHTDSRNDKFDFVIEVDYDPSEKTVTEIIDVCVWVPGGHMINITDFAIEVLNVGNLVDAIDWTEVYAEEMESKKEEVC